MNSKDKIEAPLVNTAEKIHRDHYTERDDFQNEYNQLAEVEFRPSSG